MNDHKFEFVEDYYEMLKEFKHLGDVQRERLYRWYEAHDSDNYPLKTFISRRFPNEGHESEEKPDDEAET